MRILYISYDGMLEPLGQSQVLAYLRPLALTQNIHLISYEKKADWCNSIERIRLSQSLSKFGIAWHPLRYHRRISILATSWDVGCGIIVGIWLVLRYRLQIIHARSYVPSVISLIIKYFFGVKYIFDMRGFWADERVDGGLWRINGSNYKVAKWFEKKFLLAADHVVVLSHATIFELSNFIYLRNQLPPITVIPTCADLNIFTPKKNNIKNSNFVFGYVGSVGTWYLFEEAIVCFRELLRLRPLAKFLILNRNEHSFIKEKLSEANIADSNYELISATHSEMPNHISRMDASVFFIKPVYSKKASSPTKLAEFLGCGVPCICNAGVGDIAEILETESVGIVLSSFNLAAIKNGLQQLLLLVENSTTTGKCVSVAHKYFSLEDGVNKYRRIYEQLK